MEITEIKEVTHTQIEEVIIGRKCDICDKTIEPTENTLLPEYNYFSIHTWHNDWGNDSVDSHEYFDACCPECVTVFTKDYCQKVFDECRNTRNIQIERMEM